ncbi:MAG: hypothetical protein GY932_14470, partial [Arcobacter sp.]|nr:hypothetical protein [Arcobacter sp.]
MESENRETKKRSKALPITIIVLLLIAGGAYVLSYHNVPSLKVTPDNLVFKDSEKEKEIAIKNVYEKKGIFGVFNFGIIN